MRTSHPVETILDQFSLRPPPSHFRDQPKLIESITRLEPSIVSAISGFFSEKLLATSMRDALERRTSRPERSHHRHSADRRLWIYNGSQLVQHRPFNGNLL